MLILTRRPDERFTLFTTDGPIEIIVVGLKAGGVKLGIEAPREVEILRNELIPPDRVPA